MSATSCAPQRDTPGLALAGPVTPAARRAPGVVLEPGRAQTVSVELGSVRSLLVLNSEVAKQPAPAFGIRVAGLSAGGQPVELGSNVVPRAQRSASFLLRVPGALLASWRASKVEPALRLELVPVGDAAALPERVQVTLSFREPG